MGHIKINHDLGGLKRNEWCDKNVDCHCTECDIHCSWNEYYNHLESSHGLTKSCGPSDAAVDVDNNLYRDLNVPDLHLLDKKIEGSQKGSGFVEIEALCNEWTDMSSSAKCNDWEVVPSLHKCNEWADVPSSKCCAANIENSIFPSDSEIIKTHQFD